METLGRSDIIARTGELWEGYLRAGVEPSNVPQPVQGWVRVYHRRMEGLAADVAAFILAGGGSTRMGADKASVALDGRTLLTRALDLARRVTADVRIVGDAAKFRVFAPVVEDVFRGCGPLGGIHAALRASSAELNLMLAVDMPLVSHPLLEFLIARARDSEKLVTVPRVRDGWQPLCAVYRLAFGGLADEALRAGRYKIDALFAADDICVVEQKDLDAAGFSVELFRNLNRPEELAEAGAGMRNGRE